VGSNPTLSASHCKNPLVSSIKGFFLWFTRQVLQTGIPFLWITTLHLPSHLAKSRHGVFYLRLTFRTGGVSTERRISLRTKNPQEARFNALNEAKYKFRDEKESQHNIW